MGTFLSSPHTATRQTLPPGSGAQDAPCEVLSGCFLWAEVISCFLSLHQGAVVSPVARFQVEVWGSSWGRQVPQHPIGDRKVLMLL